MRTADIEAKLVVGGLTDDARAVALEELGRRAAGDIDASPADPGPPVLAEETQPGPLPAPMEWSALTWLAVYGCSLIVVAAFGATSKNSADQGLLTSVIFIQAAVLSVAVRALAGLFESSTADDIVTTVVRVFVLGAVLWGLTMCSALLQIGWLGG